MLWDASETSVNVRLKGQGDVSWPRNFAALLKYGEEHGNCNVLFKVSYECILPGMGNNGEDFHYMGKLGQWLSDQRRRKRGTKGNRILTFDREAQLQQLVDEGK